MNNRNLAKRVLSIAVCLAYALCVARLTAATPADLDFDSASGPGISSRIIGDWQFRLLDPSGVEDNGGGDFVEVIDSSFTNDTALASGSDNALLLEGTYGLALSGQIRSRFGDPFSLVSFHIDGFDTTYLITGYQAGLPVPGATQSVYSASFIDTTVSIANTNFQNIDEFRIAREDGLTDFFVFIDDINVSPAVATSANPVIGNLTGDSVIFLEGSPAVRLDAGTSATVTDTDSADFHGGAIVVGITAGRIPPQDVLSITNQGTGTGQIGVSGTNITYEGTLVASFTGGSSYDDLFIVLNNNASKTAARGILRALIFYNTSTGVPITGARGITIRIYDGDGGYGVATTTVTVALNNYAPTVTTAFGTNVFNEGINEPSYPIVVDETAVADDDDNNSLASGTVTIIRNFAVGEDVLLFTNVPSTMGNITATYDDDAGVLTLTSAGATATLTNWTAALRGVYYSNTSDTPSTSTRTITFALNDGADFGTGTTNFVRVNAYNDAPENTIPTNILSAQVDSVITFSTGGGTAISVADADAVSNSIQVSVTCSTGSISLASITGLSFLAGTGTNDDIVGFTGTVSNINVALAGATYTPPAGYSGDASIVIFTSDLGNSGTGGFLVDSDTVQLNFDSTAPAAPVFTGVSDDTGTPGDQVTADTTVILHGTAESNAVITVTRVGTGVIGTTNASLSGEWSFDYRSTLLPEGTNQFTATATDAANNTSSAIAIFEVVVLDTIPPTIDSITRSGANPAAGPSVSFLVEFSEPTVGVDISDFTVVLSGTAAGVISAIEQVGLFPQNFSVTISNVTGDGTLRLDLIDSATGIADLAGQAITNGYTSGEAYTIDNTPPAAPAITAISNDSGVDGDLVTVDATLVLSGTAEANSLVTITRVGTGVIGSTNANGSGAWVFDYTGTTLPDGTNVFTATATDLAGNTSGGSASFLVINDTSIAIPVLSAISNDTGQDGDLITTDSTLVITGTAEPNSVVTITRVGTGVIGSTNANNSGAWSFDYTITTLPDGTNVFTASATDIAGNASGTSAGFSVVNDTSISAPVFLAISNDTDQEGDLVTIDATLVLSGTAEANSTVNITRVGTGVIGSTNANGSGAWSFDYTDTVLPDGTNLFTATATDVAGNVSSVSATFSVFVDSSFSLRFLSTPTLFVAKKPAVKVEASAALDAGNRTEFGGGSLIVSIPTNGTSGDVLSVYSATNSELGISLVGTNVLWGDLLMATLTRGNVVTNPLTFSFTTNATPSAVQALVREISFLTTNASTLSRTLRFVLTDGFGSPATAAHKTIVINKALPVGTVASLFTNSVGTFSGLVLRTNDVVTSQAGYFQVKITTGLKYSGYALIAGKKSSFSGQFNTNGESSIITSGNKFGVDLQLTPDASAIFGRLTSYTLGGWSSDMTGYLTAIGTTTNRAVATGAYTLLLPSSNDPEVGSGWATITVDRLGQTKLKGSLGDGLAWTASSAIGTNAYWPLYASVDKKLGAVIGWLTFSNTTPATIGGTLTWLKPASAPYFTNGVASELDVTGSRYVAPLGTNSILSWTNGVLWLANGNLPAPITNTVNITTLGKFTGSSGSISNLTLSINAKAGSFTGGFRHPATSATRKFSGVLLQSENLGGGHFLGTNRGGVLRLESAD